METFVVRIWIPGASEARPTPNVLRGFVQHSRNGGAASFSNGDELLASLRILLASPPGTDEAAHDERATTGGTR